MDQFQRQIERKTKIPKEQQHLLSQGKTMKNSQKIGSYNIKEGETIEMTTALLGGMKRDEPMPCSITEERKTKRKASEASTEISEVEEDKCTKGS